MSNDPMAPRTPAGGSLAGPLSMVTLVVSELEPARRFYVDVMEMTESAGEGPTPASRISQAVLWGIAPGLQWSEVLLHRPALPDSPRLRLIRFEQPEAPIRPGMNALLEGGLSVGFAVRDMPAAVERGLALGFGTTAGIANLAMQRADGSAYDALECHFRAPDNVYALGVSRPADLAPVGPIEPGRNVGGPCYSAQVASPVERVLGFYTEVLGYEVRRDVVVAGPGPERGLGLPPGTQMRFLQVFAPGEASGYLVFLDFASQGLANPVAPRLPNSGVAAWSFGVRSLDEAQQRIKRLGLGDARGPLSVLVPGLGLRRVLAVETANGVLVELVEENR